MGLSKFKSAVVLISKQFEMKATLDGMIESSFAIFSLSKVTTPKNIGMHSKKKYVESVRRVSPKMKYLGDILTKDVATRELEPAKSAYAIVEFNRMPATVYVASTFVGSLVFFVRKAFHRMALQILFFFKVEVRLKRT